MDGEGGRPPAKFGRTASNMLHFALLSIHFYSTTNIQSILHARLSLLVAYQAFLGLFC